MCFSALLTSSSTADAGTAHLGGWTRAVIHVGALCGRAPTTVTAATMQGACTLLRGVSAVLQAVSDAWKTAGVRSTLMAGGTSLITPQDVTAKLFDTVTMSSN